MATGRWLVDVLKSLQYPRANDLHAEDFDWLFDIDPVVPFLEWFCDNVNADNILSSQEIKKMRQLKASGEVLLEGDKLEKALQVASMSTEEDLSVEQLQYEISMLEEDIRSTEKRKSLLAHQRSCLSANHTCATQKLSKLETVEKRAKHKYKNTRDKQNTCAAMLDASFEDLKGTFGDLLSLYHPVDNQHVEPFLSQNMLTSYKDAENVFAKELKLYTRKQFFEGINELIGTNSQSDDCKLLDINDPSSLMVKGVEPRIWEATIQECLRLKELYPNSQKRNIKGRIDMKRAEAAILYARKCKENLEDYYPEDIPTLSKRLQEAEEKKQIVAAEYTKIWDGAIPQLLTKNAMLQLAPVISGDHELKIIRQDYMASKQDELIRQLINQRARNYFLTLGYEEEERTHKSLHVHLAAVEETLEEFQKQYANRMSMMADPCLEVPKTPRNTINSKDQSLTRLHTVIGQKPTSGGHEQLFMTFQDLLESTHRLFENVQKARAAMATTDEKQQRNIQALESSIFVCEGTVTDGQSESQPMMTSSPIRNGITQLEKMLHNLEQSILEVMGDYNNKLKAIKNDQLKIKERHLFIYFFTQREQLHLEFKLLMDRVQASTVVGEI